jgi:hypothetical protein
MVTTRVITWRKNREISPPDEIPLPPPAGRCSSPSCGRDGQPAIATVCPQRDSNSCYRLEKPVS